jgi:nucleoid-associated protein YgaU
MGAVPSPDRDGRGRRVVAGRLNAGGERQRPGFASPCGAHAVRGGAGCTPYSIATDVVGDPRTRDAIVELNHGRPRPDGRAWVGGSFPAGMEVLLPATPGNDRTIEVDPGDSWWSLAAEHLGDGARWAELRDTNVGRNEPDGAVVTVEGPIHPGWTLVLDEAPPADPLVAPASHVVNSGDTLSDIVMAHYGVDDAAARDGLVQQVFAANHGVSDGRGHVLTDPDLINPGMVLTLPATDEPTTDLPETDQPAKDPPVVDLPETDQPAPVTSPAISASAPVVPDVTLAVEAPATLVAPPPYVAPPPAETVPVLADDQPQSAASSAPSWVPASGVAGVTLLATGLGSVVASRRRRRLRASRPDEQLPAPSTEAVPAVAAVQMASDAYGIARLDTALRALVGRIAGRTGGISTRPQIVLRHDDGSIEVRLNRPRALDAPWVAAADDSLAWRLAPDTPLEELVADAVGVASPCPTLVTLGRHGDAELLVDLEAVDGLEVDAPPTASVEILRSIVMQLAVSPLADVVHVVTADLAIDASHLGDRLHCASDIEEALRLAGTLASTAPLDSELDSYGLRARAGHESWEPAVVVSMQPLHSAAVVPSGVIVVAGSPGRSGWRLCQDESGWRVEPAGISLNPRGVTDADACAVAALLDDADAALVRVDPVSDSIAPPDTPTSSEWQLLVRVLGPVDVVDSSGEAVEFDRGKALELVVWLAQHRGHATRTAARTALWDTDVSNATFSNVVSDARRALAKLVTPPDGDEWIARTYAEALPLHPMVALDTDLVRDAVETARHQDGEVAIATLRDALVLVRGTPYADVHYLWPDAEALPSQLTLQATSVAVELAARCLEAGHFDQVLDVTARGLAVLPGHEELVCLRMRAHARAGDRAAVRYEFATYERAVLADPWAEGELASDVVGLRNELLGV